MSARYPTIGEAVDEGRAWYDLVMRLLDQNPGVLNEDQTAALDVDLDDLIRRIDALQVCENCERNPCRCDA